MYDRIVYDPDLKRPACAILQAVYGAPPGVASRFDSKFWLINPTPGMRLFSISDPAQLDALVAITEKGAIPE